jgi:ABC-type polar amino acid transport system ATPase subunit
MITAVNINKSFGKYHVLKDISIELNPGEITILCGPSGCGKTTFLRNLSLLDYPDSGELKIFGQEYRFPLKKNDILVFPYPELTVVFQQLFLWPHLTNKENIKIALDTKRNDYRERLRSLLNLIDKMGMNSYIDKFPNECSLGQKQRIAIARALVLNPKFIMFDEITASLDILQTNHIIEMILQLRDKKMGFLYITHNIDLAKKIGDNLIFMQDGKIIETGRIDILLKPKSKELKQFLGINM